MLKALHDYILLLDMTIQLHSNVRDNQEVNRSGQPKENSFFFQRHKYFVYQIRKTKFMVCTSEDVEK